MERKDVNAVVAFGVGCFGVGYILGGFSKYWPPIKQAMQMEKLICDFAEWISANQELALMDNDKFIEMFAERIMFIGIAGKAMERGS